MKKPGMGQLFPDNFRGLVTEVQSGILRFLSKNAVFEQIPNL